MPSPLTISASQRIARLERRRRWLIRCGFLSLFVLFALFLKLSPSSTGVAFLLFLATIAPLCAAVLYSFFAIDGQIYKLRQESLRRPAQT